jgi:hypothetical protein
VARSRDQLFYMDEGTDAEFETDADGRITVISVVKGGILSLFGPKTGKGTRIISANASASIRGTTTYFAWQEEHKRTYVCCCYGHLDLENNDGGGITLQTTCHNAVILPPGGGTQPTPYDAPLDHYDDDIAALEARAALGASRRENELLRAAFGTASQLIRPVRCGVVTSMSRDRPTGRTRPRS